MLKKIISSIVVISLILYTFTLNTYAFGPISPEHNHLYYIKNVRSGKYLTVSGTNIEQNELSSLETQRFFIRFSKTLNGITYYHIIPDCNHQYCIDVNNALDANGTNIKIYSSTTTVPSAQNFQFIDNGNNKYQIMPELSSSRVWDVANASTINGANVQLYTRRNLNDSYVNAQQWVLYTVEKSINSQKLVDSSKHLDYDCSQTFTSYAASAAGIWNGYRSGVIRKYLWLVRPKDVTILGVQELTNGAAAITVYNSKEIQVSLSVWNNYDDNHKTNLLTHEIGHALGMGHIDDSSNVLYYCVNSTTSLKTSNKSSYDTAYANY